MRNKKILSLVMTLCVLGTSSMFLGSNVSAAPSKTGQNAVLKIAGDVVFTVAEKTRFMSSAGGTGYKICNIMPGETVTTTGRSPSRGADGSKWYEVVYDGTVGWVCADQLERP